MPRRKNSVYQLKITLNGSKPPIWRRIQVTDNTTLDKLHQTIQAVMGWGGYHLHQFIVAGEYYGRPHPDYDLEMHDDRKVRLSQVMFQEKDKLVYEYDFGDGWEHAVLLEKILPLETGTRYPVCLKGKRACPPEDCGGIWGYANFLDAIGDADHPEHDDMLEWIGGEFDPEAFDLDDINLRLAMMK